MSKAKAPKKPTQYAKKAKAGDLVHIKGCHVSNHGQLRRWFGSQAGTHWFTGTVQEIVYTTVDKTKMTLYDVHYLFTDGIDKVLHNKNIFHHPGAWVNPDPLPQIAILGLVILVSQPMADNYQPRPVRTPTIRVLTLCSKPYLLEQGLVQWYY
jgi:hypothetical protein